MIKTTKQLEITKSRIADFRAMLAELTNIPAEQVENSVLHQAQLAAIRSTIESLTKEIMIYESLRKGQLCAVKGGNFDELARILIQTRIAKGWTQTRLAEEVGIDTQQIQRYEANDYEGTSLARLYEVVDALEIPLTFEQLTVTKDSFEPNPDIARIQEKVSGRGQLFKMAA
jgi:transcriptional regulator with XRE-family HTH domain